MGESKRRKAAMAEMAAHPTVREEKLYALVTALHEVLDEHDDANVHEVMAALGSTVLHVVVKQGVEGPRLFREWHHSLPLAVAEVVSIIAEESAN